MRENTAARLKQIMEERKLKQVDILNLSLPYCKKYDVKMNKSDISQYVSGKMSLVKKSWLCWEWLWVFRKLGLWGLMYRKQGKITRQ